MGHATAAGSTERFFSAEELRGIFRAVFRTSTDFPGYYVRDFGAGIDSTTLRRRMVELKDGLAELCRADSGRVLACQWLGRFDHQHSSRFHRDNAEPHSFLMLGYEPSEVQSRVWVADYSRYLEDHGLSISDYFQDGRARSTASHDDELAPYVIESTPACRDSSWLLLLNNSRSFIEETYGVFHRGDVVEPVAGAQRVINSVMMVLGDVGGIEPDGPEVADFITTDVVAN